MPAFPIQSTVGDPIFRSQNSSIEAVRRFSRIAADSTLKLNNQERLVSPGDDALSFSTSRRIRSEIGALKVVQETGQLNVTGLSLAINALDDIKGQLDKVKRQLVQSQVADASERDGIQAEIDLALRQIDSTAHNTKLGSRSLLDGSSTVKAFRSINGAGTITDYASNQGNSLAQSAGVQAVRVNKIGVGGPIRTLTDGTSLLSLNVSVVTKATKATMDFAAGAAGTDFSEFRITGKLGSATLRISSTGATLVDLEGPASGFNKLAAETGVVLTSAAGGAVQLTTTGFGADEFIKVELLATSAGGPTIGNVGGATPSAIGAVATAFGTAGTARVNGFDVTLSGKYGTTARFLERGFDVEMDFSTVDLGASGTAINNQTVNIDLTQGVVGLLGTSGRSGDDVHYGFMVATTENLGRGNGLNSVTNASGYLSDPGTTPSSRWGNEQIGTAAVADVGSGGRFSLDTGNFQQALHTVDAAIGQVITEQTRLGTLQGNFIGAITRAETGIGNLTSADADIIGVDAATEITNLVHAQLGASTATSLMSQANSLQANIFQLLRG